MSIGFGIIALGHGGGVPGPIPGTSVVASGNTNFALVPNVTDDIYEDALIHIRSPDKWDFISAILGATPYWLIDCGPETALRLCGALGQPPVSQNCQGIFLTHFHDDHSGGLKSLAYRCSFIDSVRPMLGYPLNPWDTTFNELLASQLKEFQYLKPSVPFGAGGMEFFYQGKSLQVGLPTPIANAGLQVTPFPVDHNCFRQRWQESRDPFPAYGYTIAIPGGKSVTFSGDTAYPLPLDKFVDSEFVIHDVQFYNDGSKKDQVHCPYAWLRDAVPPEHRHKVWLTHTGHETPPEALTDGFAGTFKQGRMMVLK